ncbi:MAG: hypothetical protein GY863_23370 [bacterium]|nr:hypothetical protein [bacterium]
MNKSIQTIFLIVLLFVCGTSYGQESFPVLKGPYIGQKPPGEKSEIFAPGVISLGLHEHGFVISPDGNEAFYVKKSDSYNIMHIRRTGGRWQAPELASFCSDYNDMGPRFSHDGKKVFFGSKRPIGDRADFNIWMAEKNGDKWSEPVEIGSTVNTIYNEANPSIASNGNLYFQYFESGGLKSDLYFSPYENGKYGKPVKLPAEINTVEYNEGGPFIAPDESYIMFHSGRTGGYGSMDLYISFRDPNGSWGVPQNLGGGINTPFGESGPYITPDMKYLFFSNYFGAGKGHIFWTDAAIIETLRSEKR